MTRLNDIVMDVNLNRREQAKALYPHLSEKMALEDLKENLKIVVHLERSRNSLDTFYLIDEDRKALKDDISTILLRTGGVLPLEKGYYIQLANDTIYERFREKK